MTQSPRQGPGRPIGRRGAAGWTVPRARRAGQIGFRTGNASSRARPATRLNRDARSRGYALLFWRGRHAAELSDLDPGELTSFTSELVRVCRAIETHYRPAKLNLLVLGNGLPHLHVHIVPRFVDDASPGHPPRFMMVDQDWPPIGDEDYQRQLEALRDRLAP